MKKSQTNRQETSGIVAGNDNMNQEQTSSDPVHTPAKVHGIPSYGLGRGIFDGMKKLETHFRYKGDDFTQVKREGDVAIYERRTASGFLQWEVVKIKAHDAFELGGKIIPAGESYPSTSTWGTLGFTCFTLEEAERKMERMVSHGG